MHSGSNLQHIANYIVSVDSLLDSKMFGPKLGTSVDADEFTIGTHTATKNQRFIYVVDTDQLFYGADGSGRRVQVDIVQPGKHLHVLARLSHRSPGE